MRFGKKWRNWQMSKSKQQDINKMVLQAHKRGVKVAIETSARSNTSLVVYKNGKVKSIKPEFKYVKVPNPAPKKGLSKPSPSTRKK